MNNAHEYENIEYKQSLSESKEIVESVAAFASTHGGSIVIGIAPNGSRFGVQLGRRTLEDLAEKIKTNTQPPQLPSITIEGSEQSAVITVDVEESPVKPIWAFHVPYKRVGRTNQKLSPEETKRLMDLTAGRSWDTNRCSDLRLEDIDRTAVERYLRAANLEPHTSTKDVLENLGFLTHEELTNGAALLFAKNPQRFIAEAQIKCARFAANTTVNFLDEQTIEGNLLTQIESAIAFVRRNTQQSIIITGRPERETVSEYPDEAVREAIINALCHRDYTASGTVQVRIFDGRLEVWNPGVLPPDLTIQDLYTEHASKPRHKHLAIALHHAHVMEHWGTGTLRIVEACLNRGMPRPEFISQMGSFIVRFVKVNSDLQTTEPSPDFFVNYLMPYLKAHGRIATRQYAFLFSVSASKALDDLNMFVKQGLLERRGKGRSTHYVLSSASMKTSPSSKV
jgi:ATP-dependent DNA helicase RecG